MNLGVILFLAWTALEVVFIIATILWTVENGDWKNIEQPKYDMMEEREPADWPGRTPWPKREPPKSKHEKLQLPVKG